MQRNRPRHDSFDYRTIGTDQHIEEWIEFGYDNDLLRPGYCNRLEAGLLDSRRNRNLRPYRSRR